MAPVLAELDGHAPGYVRGARMSMPKKHALRVWRAQSEKPVHPGIDESCRRPVVGLLKA